MTRMKSEFHSNALTNILLFTKFKTRFSHDEAHIIIHITNCKTITAFNHLYLVSKTIRCCTLKFETCNEKT